MSSATLPRSSIDPIGPVHGPEISELFRLIEAKPADPTTPMLIGTDGEQVALPDEVYRVLTIVVSEMKAGHAVTITPISQRISTQEAADLLGISRPTLVKLLETGKIPFEQPGRHRRLMLSDVLDYRESRHRAAMVALDEMTSDAAAAGLYEDRARDYVEALQNSRSRKSAARPSTS